MNSSGRTLIVLIGGVVIVTLLAGLLLSGVAATFAWMVGGGYGSGPALCQAVMPWTDSAKPAATFTLGGDTSPCVPASEVGARVVAWAHAMANALYVNPACGGRISYPDCLCWLLRTSVRKIGGLLPFDLFPLSLPSRRERCIRSENREQANQCSANSEANTSATKQRYEAFSSFTRKETRQGKQNHSIPLVRPPLRLVYFTHP
jgi:hypothetical protein